MLGEHRVAAVVCYEAIHAAAVSSLVDDDTDLPLTVANHGWFRGSSERELHLAMARFRAIEHRRFMVLATTYGISAIVSPPGVITARSSKDRMGTLRGRIEWLRGSTVYSRYGFAWPYLGFAVIIVLCWLTRCHLVGTEPGSRAK